MKEKILKRELICKGKVFGIEKATIAVARGKVVNWEIGLFPTSRSGRGEGVVILAIDKKRNILLIKKYMGAEHKRIFTLPMGALKQNASKLKTAKEELAEETGYGAGKWSYIMPLSILPGYLRAKTHFFIARDIYPLKNPPKGDEVEYLKTYKMPLKKALEMIKTGKITDSRTCACLLYADKFLI